MSCCAVAAGRDEQREDEQRAGDLARRGDREPEHEQEAEASSADRHAAARRDVGVDRGEEAAAGRSPASTAQRGDGDDEQRRDLPARDAEELPNSSESRLLSTPW